MPEIVCPHCGETFWKSGEDSWKDIDILIKGNCEFIPVECHFCEDFFFVRSLISFEVRSDDINLETEFSKEHNLTRLEFKDIIN